MNFLGLSESTTYHFISVARKAKQVPALSKAVQTDRLSVSKAARIVSKLTNQNAKELIEFAERHSAREIEQRLNPETKVTIKVSAKLLNKIKRAQAVTSGALALESVLEKALDEYLHRHDPLEKAKRSRVAGRSHEGQPIKVSLRNQILRRDGGRCTHIDATGKRCSNERWLHVHHIRPRADGGNNEPGNLTTLCAAHHDLVHQSSLPIEGQVTWLREGTRSYGRRHNVVSERPFSGNKVTT